VEVVYVAKTAALAPYWVAREEGAFTRNGLNVELRQVPDAQTAYTYLVNSAAQVYLTPLDNTLIARAANGTDLAVLGGQPDLAIVTLRPLLASRELILERFLRGVLEGIHTLETRPDAGQALLAREGLSASSDAALLQHLERVPYLSPDDLTPLIAAGATADPRAAALDPNRLLDQTVLRRLEASGFVAALYRA
jgi:ABC-type nitrate/sulfonate/bicarbonate transport system substrate-binding protein